MDEPRPARGKTPKRKRRSKAVPPEVRERYVNARAFAVRKGLRLEPNELSRREGKLWKITTERGEVVGKLSSLKDAERFIRKWRRRKAKK